MHYKCTMDADLCLVTCCRYMGDERFQLAMSVGLGINMMGGDEFRRRQGAEGGDEPVTNPSSSRPQEASSVSKSTPQPPKPKEVLSHVSCDKKAVLTHGADIYTCWSRLCEGMPGVLICTLLGFTPAGQ